MSRKATSINLRERENQNCHGNCTEEERRSRTDNDLCRVTVSELDELPVRCVGEWAHKKIHFLVKYFGIFSKGMHNLWRGNLNYIELCSGPGRCIFRENRQEVDGTALAILNDNHFQYIKSATFIDINSDVVSILNDRINRMGLDSKAIAVEGDYKNYSQMKEYMQRIPENCLNLMLIDPTDCSLPFHTIRIIKEELKKVDLIINVPIFSDVGRNVKDAILDPNSYANSLDKYSCFLGDNDYLQNGNIAEAVRSGAQLDVIRNMLLEKYKDQLRNIGYQYFGIEVVKRRGVNLYYLLFASADERGLDFWNKVTISDDLGQTSLNLW